MPTTPATEADHFLVEFGPGPYDENDKEAIKRALPELSEAARVILVNQVFTEEERLELGPVIQAYRYPPEPRPLS